MNSDAAFVRAPFRARFAARRPAFTLVEVLVVIAIIGILVALILPAVQAAREAARRMKCQNHLKQQALAIANYADTLRVFPASGIVDTSAFRYESRSGPMFSWAVLILPYLEQGTLHDQFDFTRRVLDQPHEPQAAQPAVYLCPSDGSRGLFFEDASLTGGKRLGKGNYAAFVSPYHVEYQHLYRGALTSHSSHTHASFAQDGSSNILMLSEVRTLERPADQRGAWAIGWNGASLLAYDLHDQRQVLATSAGYLPDLNLVGFTHRPNNQGPNFDILYDCEPNGSKARRMPCATWTPGGSMEYFSAAPRSHHPGGVNAAYADGHIGFLPDTIDSLTMAYLISIEDGQAVQPP